MALYYTVVLFSSDSTQLNQMKKIMEKLKHEKDTDNYRISLRVAIQERSLQNLQKLILDPGCNLDTMIKLPPLFLDSSSARTNCTPLHFAVLMNSPDRLKGPSAPDDSEAEMVRMLLASGRVNVNAEDKVGRTALHYAAEFHCMTAARLLIANPLCDLNAVEDLMGYTPLHMATVGRPGQDQVFDLLLAHSGGRCNVNAKTASKETVLHMAMTTNAKIMNSLLFNRHFTEWDTKNKEGRSALGQRIASNIAMDDSLIVSVLKSQKCDVREVDESSGNTLLHYAIWLRKRQAVPELLMSHGISDVINVLDKKGLSPLHHAIDLGDVTFAQLLVNHPACNLNYSGADGMTPLHQAASEGRLNIVKLLVVSGRCNLLVFDANGNSPLHAACAAEKLSFEVINFLVDRQVYNIDARNMIGQTPLICFSRDVSLLATNETLTHVFRCFRYLIENGADVNAADVMGRSALYFVATSYASGAGRSSMQLIVRILLDAGADVSSYGSSLAFRTTSEPAIRSQLAAEGALETCPESFEPKQVLEDTSDSSPHGQKKRGLYKMGRSAEKKCTIM